MPNTSVAKISASELKGTDMLATKLLTVASSLQRWNDELKALAVIPAPTPVQASRRADLRSSISSYMAYVEELDRKLPSGPWINRANAYTEAN